MASQKNQFNTTDKALIIADSLELSQKSTEFLEKFNESTEKAFDKILSKGILFPIGSLSCWVTFITKSKIYYNKRNEINRTQPDILTKKINSSETSTSNKFYWQMLLKMDSISKKEKMLKIINKYIQQDQLKNKNKYLINDLIVFEKELKLIKQKQNILWNKTKIEIITSLIKAITITISTTYKLGLNIAAPIALPWTLSLISLAEMGNNIYELYKLNNDNKKNQNEISRLYKLKSLIDKNTDIETTSIDEKIKRLKQKSIQIKNHKKQAAVESLTGAIVVFASVAFLATPAAHLAISIISMTAFLSIALISLYKGRSLVKNEYKKLKKTNPKNIEYKDIETQMNHTDLLFGSNIEKTNFNLKKQKDKATEEGEGEGEKI